MKIFSFILVTIILIILLALPTMLLWNYLMPDIFGLDTIGFWQALAITIFSRILFSNYNYSNE